MNSFSVTCQSRAVDCPKPSFDPDFIPLATMCDPWLTPWFFRSFFTQEVESGSSTGVISMLQQQSAGMTAGLRTTCQGSMRPLE